MSEPARTDSAAGPEKRRHIRKKVIWSGRLSSPIGERACTVLNISRGGAQIKLDATLDPCAIVALTIGGIGRLPGWVVWASYDRAGVQFDALPDGVAEAVDQALRGRRGQPLTAVLTLA